MLLSPRPTPCEPTLVSVSRDIFVATGQCAYAHYRLTEPLFFTAVDEGVFPFKLATSGSSLSVARTRIYTLSIDYRDSSPATVFWQIGGGETLVNDEMVNSSFQAITDTGNTIMYGPPPGVKIFCGAISGSGVYDSSQGCCYHPCNSAPTVAFSFGGKS